MKKIIRFSILYLFVLSCNKSPVEVNSQATGFDTAFITTSFGGLQSVYFLNEKDGFVSTYNGGLYKTTDSAKNWTALNSTTTLPIRDIYFTDSQVGFAVGGLNSCGGTGCIPPGGFILKTIDGGQSWTNVFTPTDKIEITSICFVNSSLGFCVGDDIVFKTTDGGQTWSEHKINNIGGKMMQIKFTSSSKGYIVCLFGKILVTEDGGATWQIENPNGNIGYYAISEKDGSIFVSGQGKIIKSTNGGGSWSELSSSPSDIYAIHFISNQTGFAFGSGNYSGGDSGFPFGSIYYTNDGGVSWDGTGDIKEVGLIQDVSFPTNKLAYAISGNKIIKLTVK